MSAGDRLASKLPAATAGSTLPITAVLADRNSSSYLGIVATILRGNTYVPLNVTHPVQHNVDVLRRSGARVLVCGDSLAPYLDKLFLQAPRLIDNIAVIHCGSSRADFDLSGPLATTAFTPWNHGVAYILFTSGSTGAPKGVPVRYGNLLGYLSAVNSIMDVSHDDRFPRCLNCLLICRYTT